MYCPGRAASAKRIERTETQADELVHEFGLAEPDEELVLGGGQGIGKDCLLEPVKRTVGPWNFAEVSPQQMLGRFNGFLRSVILRACPKSY